MEAEARAVVAASVYESGSAKHWVRVEGWLLAVQQFIDVMRTEGVERPIKYLTLPGLHALDIGLLHREGFLDVTDGVMNVAICDKDHAESVAASLAHIGRPLAISSKLLHVELASRDSELVKAFPFDVVNYDSTGALIAPVRNGTLEVLDRIFALQRGQEFLLFITTRVEETAHERLRQIVAANLEHEPRFREEYIQRYGDTDVASCSVVREEFEHMGIAKYVARTAADWHYAVSETFVGNYVRCFQNRDGLQTYRMICHSFWCRSAARRAGQPRFEPIYSARSMNMQERRFLVPTSSTIQQAVNAGYAEFVCQIPKRMPIDIDAYLQEVPQLKAALAADVEELNGWQNA